MNKKSDTEKTATVDAVDRGVCGIVMPIAAMGEDYSREHWDRVRKILLRSIDQAGLKGQLVWENTESDVIHSAILKNLYENDVVICDVSGLNPNVMLEAGLRLSTKKPTIIVTDGESKPPFDIGNIGYLRYRKDLEYNSVDAFIGELSRKVKEFDTAYKRGEYKSFVAQFTFENVTPTTIDVPAEQYIKDQLEALNASIKRLERQDVRETAGIPPLGARARLVHVSFEAKVTNPGLGRLMGDILEIPEVRAAAIQEQYEDRCIISVTINQSTIPVQATADKIRVWISVYEAVEERS